MTLQSNFRMGDKQHVDALNFICRVNRVSISKSYLTLLSHLLVLKLFHDLDQ